MIDFWDETIKKGTPLNIPIIAVNDLDKDRKGKIRLRILNNETVVQEKTEEIIIAAYSQNKSYNIYMYQLKSLFLNHLQTWSRSPTIVTPAFRSDYKDITINGKETRRDLDR